MSYSNYKRSPDGTMVSQIDGIFRSEHLSSQSQARKSFRLCLRLPGGKMGCVPHYPSGFRVRSRISCVLVQSQIAVGDTEHDCICCTGCFLRTIPFTCPSCQNCPSIRSTMLVTCQFSTAKSDLASQSAFEPQHFFRANETLMCIASALRLCLCRP